ncbi:hypothetical protein [Rhodomicrobium lacus]|uniref:hypothetical protein n=1 Tax=Rhodomicrobium lacus TaxID=2498452 RepID=UPI000F8D0C83|nr:hypothetical protein [Rhodomicrobium lacus]
MTRVRETTCILLAAALTGVAADTKVKAAAPASVTAGASAPLSWRDFARKIRDDLQKRLAVSDEQTRHAYNVLAGTERVSPIIAKVWVDPSGSVERIEFDGVSTEGATALRSILLRASAGEAPPSDLLQPVLLKLSLPHSQ